MEKILNALKDKKILVSDGAWGTFFMKKGLEPGACPETWNLERANDVYDVAKSYVDAGADIILTNSFGGTSVKLGHYGLDIKAAEINKAAAAISRKAAGTKAFVAASMGPTGKFLMMGELSPEEMYDTYKQQAIALAEGGADAIIAETMTDLEEACIAVRAAKEGTGLEVICTMTFEKTPDGEFRSMMGISPSDAVEPLIEAGADIIGANCGNGSAGMIEIVKEMRKINATIPILIHANAGLPEMVDGQMVFPESPEDMARQANAVIAAGANIIGGCCGTTPEHIKKIAEAVR